jgi:ArsR family transcriptional regulator, arsenate/arsenite/antimonite-responsive transcriptional repressor
MDNIVRIMKSLSDGTRLRIISLLLKSDKPVCICELVDALDLAQYNVSKHMKELKYAGLVNERREGKFIYYSVVPEQDKFLKTIFAAVQTLPEKTLEEDKKRLCCRLMDRIGGKCCG